MPNTETGKIRNVAVIGHRGTGKTSLVEALLYESGTTNRLGTVADRSTVSDYDDEERRRGMSISATVTHLAWQDRSINLVDTPGEPSFQADVLSTLRVVEGAIVVVSGVLGVEVGTERLWRRCDELGLSRLLLVNLLDRERADFFTTLEGLQSRLSDRCVAVELPIGTEHEFHGVVDLVHMVAYLHDGDAGVHDEPAEIPEDMKAVADEYHDKLMDVVAETSDELMERYLEGDEISRDERIASTDASASLSSSGRGSTMAHPVPHVPANRCTSRKSARLNASAVYSAFRNSISSASSFATRRSTMRNPRSTASTRSASGACVPRPIPA